MDEKKKEGGVENTAKRGRGEGSKAGEAAALAAAAVAAAQGGDPPEENDPEAAQGNDPDVPKVKRTRKGRGKGNMRLGGRFGRRSVGGNGAGVGWDDE